MIKGIIFDWGGVFTHQGSFEAVIDDFVKRFEADAAETLAQMTAFWQAPRSGQKPSRYFWDGLSRHLRADPKAVREHLDSLFQFNPETLTLAHSLRGRYKLGLLSNHIEDWLEEKIAQYELRALFDAIVGSYAVKLRKPDEAIYRHTLDALALAPEQSVFIDDKPANVEAANALGMHGIRFESITQLKGKLTKLGVQAD